MNTTKSKAGVENAEKESISQEPGVYSKPVLTQYGDISTLVRSMGGLGTDGNPVPSFSLT